MNIYVPILDVESVYTIKEGVADEKVNRDVSILLPSEYVNVY